MQPSNHVPFDEVETNSLALNQQEEELIAGCGDNNVYIWDLNTGDQKNVLKGHKDYIHCVSYFKKDKQIISTGEDGIVNFWDSKNEQVVEKIEPNQLEMLLLMSSQPTWIVVWCRN